VNLNDDVIYRCLRLGALHQRHPGRSRSLVRHHDRLHVRLPVLFYCCHRRHPHSIRGGHIVKRGRDPSCIACERDLEGIVAKSARGRCQSDGRSTSWLKIKNEDYSRDGAALNGRRLYWGGNSQTVPLLNSPALGQKKEFKCSLKLR
jgi:hypothetical protein